MLSMDPSAHSKEETILSRTVFIQIHFLVASKVVKKLSLATFLLTGIFLGPESCGIVSPPHTVSVSFLQDESTVTPAFANRQCSEYAKVKTF